MITVVESFSAGVRVRYDHDPSSVIFDAFSVGISDDRYPKGSTIVCSYFACGTGAGLDLPDVLFVRQK